MTHPAGSATPSEQHFHPPPPPPRANHWGEASPRLAERASITPPRSPNRLDPSSKVVFPSQGQHVPAPGHGALSQRGVRNRLCRGGLAAQSEKTKRQRGLSAEQSAASAGVQPPLPSSQLAASWTRDFAPPPRICLFWRGEGTTRVVPASSCLPVRHRAVNGQFGTVSPTTQPKPRRGALGRAPARAGFPRTAREMLRKEHK